MTTADGFSMTPQESVSCPGQENTSSPQASAGLRLLVYLKQMRTFLLATPVYDITLRYCQIAQAMMTNLICT